ncbi:hypothetical protein BD410DRAFT_796767 [Rickenella mellea]|uniref:Uncharacterized protein n=1 Tax=Rickenella mellea TaxID=50990 RepID=A0A4Y7PKS6_9AGAM|nr:hypothetical protein BD410DRAFT_796767 [Rickenella mellea]
MSSQSQSPSPVDTGVPALPSWPGGLPPPQQTGTPGTQSTPATASTLYLYTFVATLVVLLAISGAIILRSIILRRRQRRLVEEAIRNGTYVPPSQRYDPKLAKRPLLHDAYMKEAHVHQPESSEMTMEKWSDIRPLSAAIVPSKAAATLAPLSVSGGMYGQQIGIRGLARRLGPNPFNWVDRLLDPPPHSPTPPTPPTPTYDSTVPVSSPHLSPSSPTATHPQPHILRVAVLISMPNPHHHHQSRKNAPSPIPLSTPNKGKDKDDVSTICSIDIDGAEAELNPMEFGVAECVLVSGGAKHDGVVSC